MGTREAIPGAEPDLKAYHRLRGVLGLLPHTLRPAAPLPSTIGCHCGLLSSLGPRPLAQLGRLSVLCSLQTRQKRPGVLRLCLNSPLWGKRSVQMISSVTWWSGTPWHTLIRPENYVLNVVRLWLATLRLGQLKWPRLQRRASWDVARVPRLPTQVGSPAHDAMPGFPREFPPRFVRREWLSLDYMPWFRPVSGQHQHRPPSPQAEFWAEALVLRVSGWLCCWSDVLLLETKQLGFYA